MGASNAIPVLRPDAYSLDYGQARQHMVESQLAPNGVMRAALLAAAAILGREKCVLPGQESMAYTDQTICYGTTGAYLLDPTTLYRLIEHAELAADEKVLLVNSGMGYAAALAAACGAKGVALEINADLAKRAYNFLQQQGDSAFVCKSGSLVKGWSRQAPYDVILVAGALAEIPPAYLKQLSENGRIIALAPDNMGMQRAQRWQRLHGQLSNKILFDAAAPFLPELAPQPQFTF